MNKFEHGFMRFAERWQVNPSRWVPHVRPFGVYEMGTAYPDGAAMFDDEGNLAEGEPVPIECFSIYGVFWTICWERRKRRLGEDEHGVPAGKAGFWESLWSFLVEVDLGIYDTTAWVPAEVIG